MKLHKPPKPYKTLNEIETRLFNDMCKMLIDKKGLFEFMPPILSAVSIYIIEIQNQRDLLRGEPPSFLQEERRHLRKTILEVELVLLSFGLEPENFKAAGMEWPGDIKP